VLRRKISPPRIRSPGDHLSFGVAGDNFWLDTPLRAFLPGITANSLSVRSSYVWDETRSATLAASYLPSTDGNRWLVLDGKFDQKLVEVPHFGLTAYAELCQSRNSLAGALYCNPGADDDRARSGCWPGGMSRAGRMFRSGRSGRSDPPVG
jgi:hypothetical protein